jgi:hypothetical protein
VISRDKLKAGAYYFFVTYEDRNRTIPVIETLRFKSEVLEGRAGKTLLLFDRVGEHEPPQCRLTEELLETSVFEFDELISELEASRGGSTPARKR